MTKQSLINRLFSFFSKKEVEKIVETKAKQEGYITPLEAKGMIEKAGGRFFTVEFNKKTTGSPRKMNSQVIKGEAFDKNLVRVKEASKAKHNPQDCIRQFDVNTLTSIKIKGETFKICGK